MRRRLALVLAAALTVLVIASCGSDDEADVAGSASADVEPTGATAGPVKVGFMNPLSGQFASIGKSFQQGLDLYLEQHDNRLGGREVRLVTVDEGAGAASAVPGARKLIQQDKVDIVTGIVSSATAAAVFPQFDQAKIPVVFSQGFPTPVPSTDPSPYLWSAGSTNPPYTVGMANYMVEQVPADKGVYFIAAEYTQGHAIIDATKAAFEKAGGKVAGESYAPLGTTLDYQPYLSRIRQSGAGAVYAFFGGSDAVRFVQQYKSFGLAGKVPLYSTGSLIAGPNLAAQGAAAIGITTNSHYNAHLDNAANQAFVEAYRAKYGSDPDNFAMQQYDAVHIIDLALSEVDGALSGDKIVEGLEAIGELETPRGTWRLGADTHVPVHTMYLFEVRDEGGKPVNTLVEELGIFDPVTGEKAE